jgi:hypothetical protein
MEEPKPYLLTLVSIFLLISVGLLATTIYLYFNNPSQKVDVLQNKKTNTGVTVSTRDSLVKIYSAAIKDIDASFAAMPASFSNESENTEPVNTIDTAASLQKLRTEINTILSNKSSSADLESAKEKITELQVMVEVLKNKNNQVIEENKRLNAILKQVNNNNEKNVTANNTNTEETNRIKKAAGVVIKAENLQVAAASETDFLEKETTKAVETDKLVGSFTLKSNGGENTVSEVMVVVVQPDGQILQTSNWETGIFYTDAGKQIYSKKIRFNNNGGETRKLNFSLKAEKYLPGKYTIELYYDGNIIGRTTKTLS